ncbi:BMP family ABC transporter substrate-binding protein [Clostridium sp. AM58-1XD]|uniref:BMP family lipoprotein n=1 Tax=Clostridium sp. AM58-1XD TaxID=2292307 RepID=UPI000E49623F|nr:BMP family ABC transporter substrate-binding protein [Clostridium sp. AM58-1XD]RGY98735.1 BMP family ABC transporter substrate-binding protein [Clostridium sp. AM58-1XD]
MRKIISILLCVSMVFSVLAGCGKKAAGSSSEVQSSSAAGAVGDKAAGDNAKKMAVICSSGGLGDNGYNDASKRGLDQAAEELGLEYTIVEPAEVSQGETYLRQFAQEGYGLVVTLEYSHADAVEMVADEFPDVTFVVFNLIVDKPNVISIMFDIQDASYLAGIIAGELTKPDVTIIGDRQMKAGNTVGFISATDSPGFKVFYEAFYQGAYSVNPDIQIITDFTVGFSDTQNSKAVAINQIQSQNADVIFVAAGLAALGVFQGVKECNVLALGATDDMDAKEPGFIVTSAVKRMDTALYKLADQLLNGELEKGTVVMTLEEGGADLTDYSVIAPYITDEAKWDEIKQEVEQARKDIISGKINVVDGSMGEVFTPGA